MLGPRTDCELLKLDHQDRVTAVCHRHPYSNPRCCGGSDSRCRCASFRGRSDAHQVARCTPARIGMTVETVDVPQRIFDEQLLRGIEDADIDEHERERRKALDDIRTTVYRTSFRLLGKPELAPGLRGRRERIRRSVRRKLRRHQPGGPRHPTVPPAASPSSRERIPPMLRGRASSQRPASRAWWCRRRPTPRRAR